MFKALIFTLLFIPSVLSFSNSGNAAAPQRDVTFPVPTHQELMDHFIIYFESMVGIL